jgi:arsenite methyltransferase
MATDIKESVREKYGEAARKVSGGGAKASCCEPTSCCGTEAVTDPITANLYEAGDAALVPEKAILASLGCGNPTALAELREGETVLDLGSGGGIDVLLSARRVGPTGKAYGLDMTDEMLELARKNQLESGLENVEFLRGEIENIPLPDSSVDVIISNCVINLSADKGKVIREAFRVLKPGGRFAVSDVIRTREVPEPVRTNVELWAGCVAGALLDREYLALLADAGFEDASIETTRVYELDDARAWLAEAGIKAEEIPADADGAWISGFVRAKKGK